MNKSIVWLLVIVGFAMTIGSGNAEAAFWKRNKGPAVQTITKAELSAKMASGAPIQVVNVLSPDYYNLGVIKGSKKIPLNELDARVGELDKTKEVITYCASYKCSASREAAQKLAKLGFNVRAYEGGAKEWKASGLPLEA